MVSDGHLSVQLLGPLLGGHDPDVRLHGRNRFGRCGRALRQSGFEVWSVAWFCNDRDLKGVAFVDKTGGACTCNDYLGRQWRLEFGQSAHEVREPCQFRFHQDGCRSVEVLVRDDHEGRGLGVVFGHGGIGCHSAVLEPQKPFAGVTVDGVSDGGFLGGERLLHVLDDVIGVGGAIVHEKSVDVVAGLSSSSDPWLGSCGGVPFDEPEGRSAAPFDEFGRVHGVADCIGDVVPVGQQVSDQAFCLVDEVRRGAWFPLSGQDAEHGVGHKLLPAQESAPVFVNAVAPVVVETNVRHPSNEERQFEVGPFVEVCPTVFESLPNLLDVLRFRRLGQVSGDVRDDGINVVVAGNDWWRRHVAGGSDDGRVVRFCAAKLDEGADGVLGVEGWPAVVEVDDGGSGHHVIGALGDLAQGAAMLVVDADQRCSDAVHLVVDGVQGGVVDVRYGVVGQWRGAVVAELRVEQERVAGVVPDGVDNVAGTGREVVGHDGLRAVAGR